MGLINLFNAMTLRPHIPYRFKAEIWPNYQNAYDNNDKIFRPLEFTIKRISQPVFKLDTENKLNFGNTVFVVPILKFGDTTMEITFEETDDMRVFKTLSGLMGSELFKGVNGGLLNIRITQFDETMLTISDKKTYICRLKEYGTPSFNNNGHGSPIEISATFKVVYVVEEPTVLEEIKDGYRVIIREKLPENERIINEAQAVADEEDKQRMSKGDFDKKMRDRKIMDVLKAEQIKTSAGVAEQAMIAMGYDPTKESQIKIFDAELKMRNINLDDGLNNAELKTLTQMVKDYVDPQYATEDLLSNLNENINALEKLNTEYNNLLKESTKQPEGKLRKKETTPAHSYNGNDPLLGAVSYSYEKEVTAREGERGHVFFDMLDTGGARGTINLGSGSSEGARGYSDIGELTVNINGVTMQFKDSASLNAAVQKAFGGKEAIVDVFLANGGGKGYTSKEERKKANLKGAKAGLNQLLESSGGVIEDDYGNKSVVKMDKGLYLNIQLDENSSQRVSNKNMLVDTEGWSESTRQTVINSNQGSANKTVQGMLHFEHAYSGFKNVWNQFNKDEKNVQMLNEDIKRGTFSQATLDELSKSVDKLKVKDKTKAGFKRVIKEYGYLS